MSRRDRPAAAGHNGGPPLEEPGAGISGRCRDCRHWRALLERDERAYEYFRLGLSRRRVRRPAGACDRALLNIGRMPAFSATAADFGCFNFDPKPQASRSLGGGFVTISENGRIVWQGAEEDLPARFRQEELDLPGSS